MNDREIASAAILKTLQETEIPGAGGCLAMCLRRQAGLFAAAPSGRLGGLLHTAVARGGGTGGLHTKHPRRAAEAAPSSSVTPATMNAHSTAVRPAHRTAACRCVHPQIWIVRKQHRESPAPGYGLPSLGGIVRFGQPEARPTPGRRPRAAGNLAGAVPQPARRSMRWAATGGRVRLTLRVTFSGVRGLDASFLRGAAA
jgi:hypothetical protein